MNNESNVSVMYSAEDDKVALVIRIKDDELITYYNEEETMDLVQQLIRHVELIGNDVRSGQ
jgi:hypothetical protein